MKYEKLCNMAKRNIMVILRLKCLVIHLKCLRIPNLSCKGEYLPVNPGSYWPNTDIFCAGNDEVFTFLEDVLRGRRAVSCAILTYWRR